MSRTLSNEPQFLARRAATRFYTAVGRSRQRPALVQNRSRLVLMLKRRRPPAPAAILPKMARAGRPALWQQVSRRITDDITAIKPRYAGRLDVPAAAADLPLVNSAISQPAPESEPAFEVEAAAPLSGPPLTMAQLRQVLAQRSSADTPLPEPSPSRLSQRPMRARPTPPPAEARLQAKRQRFSRIEELPARPAERSTPPPTGDKPNLPSKSPAAPTVPPAPAASPPFEPPRVHAPPAGPEGKMTSPPVAAPTQSEPDRKLDATLSLPGVEPAASPPEPLPPAAEPVVPLPEPPPAAEPAVSLPPLRAGAPIAPETHEPEIEPVEQQPQPLTDRPAAQQTVTPVVQTSAPEKPPPPDKPSRPLEEKPPDVAQPEPPALAAAQAEPAAARDAPAGSLSKKEDEQRATPIELKSPPAQTTPAPAQPPQPRPEPDVVQAAPPPAAGEPAAALPEQELPSSPQESPGQAAAPEPTTSAAPSEADQPKAAPAEAATPEPLPILTAAKHSPDLLLNRPRRVAQRVAAKRSRWSRAVSEPDKLPAPTATVQRVEARTETSPGGLFVDSHRPQPANQAARATVQVSERQPAPAAAETVAAGSARAKRAPGSPQPAVREPQAAAPVDLPLPVIHRPHGPGPVVVQHKTEPTAQLAPVSMPEANVIARQPAVEAETPAPPTTTEPGGSSRVDLDALASQIYPLLKRRLALELERQPRW